MTSMPNRSPGLLAARFGDAFAVYDLVTHRVTIINELAGLLLTGEYRTQTDAVGSRAAHIRDGEDTKPDIRPEIGSTVTALVTAGLLGGGLPWEPPAAIRTGVDSSGPCWSRSTTKCSPPNAATSPPPPSPTSRNPTPTYTPYPQHPEPENRIAQLRHRTGRNPTVSGSIRLHGAETWEFPDRAALRVQDSGVLNDLGPRIAPVLVFHSGAVRTADGRIVLVLGLPDAGKSTLTAALVAAECADLGDELIGVHDDTLHAVGFARPPALDRLSRGVLGVEAPDPVDPFVPIEALRNDARSIDGAAGQVTGLVEEPHRRLDHVPISDRHLAGHHAMGPVAVRHRPAPGTAGTEHLDIAQVRRERPTSLVEHRHDHRPHSPATPWIDVDPFLITTGSWETHPVADIVIIGAGDQGECTLDVVRRAGRDRAVGFIDDGRNPGETVGGLQILGGIDDLTRLREDGDFDAVIIAIGDNYRRSRIADHIRVLDPGLEFATAIDPDATIGGDVEIGDGTVIQAGAIVNVGARIGIHGLVCVRASLDHHSILGDHSSLAPSVATGGRVQIGTITAIAIGATINHGRSIGSNTVIGAGSTVVHDIGDGVVAMGTPCRTVRPRSIDEPYL